MNCGWGTYEKQPGDLLGSPSRIILFREDIELYKMRYVDKTDDSTKSMDFGSLTHKCVNEPETFHLKYVVMPDRTAENDLDGKALERLCKELALKVTGTKAEKLARLREVMQIEKQYDEFLLDDHAGKIVVPPQEAKKAITIKNKIYTHEKVGPWVIFSEKEKRGWYTESNGVVMRFQIDGIFEHNGVGVIWDLKITKDWDKVRFERNIYKTGLHLQLAAYKRALKQIEGKEVNAFMVITANPSPPHQVRYLQIDSAAIEAGELELDLYLKEYKLRLENNDWSPRKQDNQIQTVSLQSWDWTRIENLGEADE